MHFMYCNAHVLILYQLQSYCTQWAMLHDFLCFLTCARGANKSLARPGRKQLQRPNSNLCKPLKKKFRKLSVQPSLGGSNDFRVGRKMATYQLFFFQSGRAKDLSAPLYHPPTIWCTSVLNQQKPNTGCDPRRATAECKQKKNSKINRRIRTTIS